MSHHENAYFVDTQLITCHAIHSPYPCIPHHSYAHTPDTAHSPVAAPVKASAQQLLKHLRSTCRSICAATAETSAQQLPKHLRSNCRSICAATAEASVQHLPKHLRGNCRNICAATAEASAQHLPKHLRSPCLTAIPYRFAMASIASVKELFSTSILRNSFVAFLQ